MRTLHIDFSYEIISPDSYIAGEIGEHNAITLLITPPPQMSKDESVTKFCVSFCANGMKILRLLLPKSDILCIPLSRRLTEYSDIDVHIEVDGYSKNLNLKNEYTKRLRFLPSLTDTIEIVGYSKPEDIPTKTSELINDSGFITRNELPEGGGGNGLDGFSPIVDVEAIEGGHRVTITDIEGTESFDILNGVDGKDGADGKDGNDYVLTEADKTEIANAVLDSLTVAEGGSY